MSGWRHVTVRISADQSLYTDQSEDEIRELLDQWAFDDFILRLCDCGGEKKFDTDENPDRMTKVSLLPVLPGSVGWLAF